MICIVASTLERRIGPRDASRGVVWASNFINGQIIMDHSVFLFRPPHSRCVDRTRRTMNMTMTVARHHDGVDVWHGLNDSQSVRPSCLHHAALMYSRVHRTRETWARGVTHAPATCHSEGCSEFSRSRSRCSTAVFRRVDRAGREFTLPMPSTQSLRRALSPKATCRMPSARFSSFSHSPKI